MGGRARHALFRHRDAVGLADTLGFRRGQRAATCGLGCIENLANRRLVVSHAFSRIRPQTTFSLRSTRISDSLNPISFKISSECSPSSGERFTSVGLSRSEEHTSELQSQSNLVC